VLALGMNFALTPNRIPTSDIITATEATARCLDPVIADQLRAGVSRALASSIVPKSNLTYAQCAALKDLRKDDGIVILPADKGNATVILDKDEYSKKMKSLFDDMTTYRPVSRDPTTRIEKKIVKSVRNLHRLGHISDKLKDRLLPSYSNPPQAYGLSKIHKEDTPLWPIISSIGSPTYMYRLAKELAHILSPPTGNTTSTVRNSSHFVQQLREVQVDQDDILVSFDVVSLFTKVPIDEAIEVVVMRLKDDDTLVERTSIPADDICSLASLCLKSTFFQFEDQLYEQIEGAAMGLPLSPIIANIYMEHFEELALTSSILQPKVWGRYVDDTFVIWPHSQSTLPQFLSHLNNIRPSIQFTMEEEVEQRIPFLDVLVKRSDQSLSTEVFQKPTHKNRYLHFRSHHHPRVLSGIVTCLKKQALDICDPDQQPTELRNLRETFQANGYPTAVLDPILARNTPTQATVTTIAAPSPQPEPQCKEHTLCLPYVKGSPRRLSPLADQFQTTSLRSNQCSGQSDTIRRSLVRVKNRIPEEKKTGVVYEVPCKDCNGVYVGETVRTLKKQISEHKQAVRCMDDKNGIAVHVQRMDHRIDWEKASIRPWNSFTGRGEFKKL